MSIEEIKKRFVNEIKLRGYEDKYIDRNEEREILQIAIQLGVSIDAARTALAQVCDGQGYVLESVVLKQIKDQVEAAAGNDGRIDQTGVRPDLRQRRAGGRRQEERPAGQEDDRAGDGGHRQQQGQDAGGSATGTRR